jgi:hypothetical protein
MTTFLGGSSNSDSNSILMALLIILIVIGIAYFIYYLYMQNTIIKVQNRDKQIQLSESEYEGEDKDEDEDEDETSNNSASMPKIVESFQNPPMQTTPKMNSKMNSNKNVNGNNNDTVCFPKDQLTADELLPTDNSSLWAQINPSGEGSFKDKNFLQSGYHIGINTVGQTLRNANLQLRSEPPCPQVKVSPWLQATIEPDLGRKPFEIGGCQ